MNSFDRTLDWDGCWNVRDLGGLATVDGRYTRRRALVRSDLLGRLTPRGKQQLLDYGVRTIIDLRSPDEVEKDPSAVFASGDHAPDYLVVAAETRTPQVMALFKQAETRAELYKISLAQYAANNVRIMRAIAGAAEGGVVIHCHSGKDRTGTTAALLLSLAGVEDDEIAADYAETQERLWPSYEKWVEEHGVDENDRWLIPITEPQTMLETLAYLQDKYGGVESYLKQAGMMAGEIERLRVRLVE
ncbi:MAG: tyrosine-protein phosphatase [Candidatus Promineifilaceae bacterium]|jgi:protein tyrosine/serine phosphatase